MTEEEKQFLLNSQQEESLGDINADKVTNKVLKICNVIRQRLDVHGESDEYVKKRSGLGGTGGRLLSPELRVRFGTFGFNKKNELAAQTVKDKPSLLSQTIDERVTSANSYTI